MNEVEKDESIRNHCAFLNGYSSEDERLYDDLISGVEGK